MQLPTKFALTILGALAAFTLAPANQHAAQAQPAAGPFSSLTSLATKQDYVTRRISSEDRDGNADNRQIGPGQTLEIANIEGPGEITHIWNTIATADENHLRNIVIRMYWDDSEFPSVESPIGDFFGLGHAQYYVFDNPVQAIGTDRGMNCFWPMPFAKRARITVTNESDINLHAYYFYVNYRTFDAPRPDSLYFHAEYRQEFPTQTGENYLITETTGTGHIAGVSMSIHTQVNGWWGEGDDIITIDGEERPSIWGTGSEDYFCGAWCYGETFYNNYFGMPLRTRQDQNLDNYWNVYRLHLEMPITFKKSIRFEIEHGHDGVSNKREPRHNDYSSVAYFYLDKPTRLSAQLPPAAKRLPKFLDMPHPEGTLETQYMDQDFPDHAKPETQQIGLGDNHYGEWLNSDQIFVRDMKPGDTATLTFETTAPMTGDAEIFVTRAHDYSQVELTLDGKLLGTYDGYNEKIDRVKLSLGHLDLQPGKHELKVKVVGKNEKSTGTFWGIDNIRIGGPTDYPEAHAPEIELKK